MDLTQILEKIAALAVALQDAQGALDLVKTEAFEAGVASRVEFVFTQADMDAKNEELAKLQAKIDEMTSGQPVDEKKFSQAELDQAVADAVAAAVPSAIADAKAALKAEFQTLLDAEEIDLEDKLKAL